MHSHRHDAIGRTLRYHFYDTALGDIVAVSSPVGLCALEFVTGTHDEAIDGLRAHFAGDILAEGSDPVQSVAVEHIRRLAAGDVADGLSDVTTDVAASEFRRRVWEGLTRIPVGETVSYSELARRIGCPTAVRAVASAVAANHIAVIIPCHRVVRSDGFPGQFRWGTPLKRRLIELEKHRR